MQISSHTPLSDPVLCRAEACFCVMRTKSSPVPKIYISAIDMPSALTNPLFAANPFQALALREGIRQTRGVLRGSPGPLRSACVPTNQPNRRDAHTAQTKPRTGASGEAKCKRVERVKCRNSGIGFPQYSPAIPIAGSAHRRSQWPVSSVPTVQRPVATGEAQRNPWTS